MTTAEQDVGAFFGLPNAPCLLARPIGNARFSVTRLHHRLIGQAGQVVVLPPDDAYFLMLYLKEAHHCDIGADGTESEVRRYRQGSICLVDLARGASVRLMSDLESLAFYLPRSLFREVAAFPRAPNETGLRCRRGEHDDIMRHIGAALLPFFEDGNAGSPALQHIAVAICAHLLQHHGDRSAGACSAAVGLSVWQEKAAKDFMIDNLGEDFPIAAAASAAGLATREFVDGFKSVTGQTPSQWLMRHRIGRAKQYLAERILPISEIATRCGFTNEEHFVRVFRRIVGATQSGRRSLH